MNTYKSLLQFSSEHILTERKNDLGGPQALKNSIKLLSLQKNKKIPSVWFSILDFLSCRDIYPSLAFCWKLPSRVAWPRWARLYQFDKRFAWWYRHKDWERAWSLYDSALLQIRRKAMSSITESKKQKRS